MSSNFNVQFLFHACDFFPIAFTTNNLLTLVNIYLFGHHFLFTLKPYGPIKVFFHLLFLGFFFFRLLNVKLPEANLFTS